MLTIQHHPVEYKGNVAYVCGDTFSSRFPYFQALLSLHYKVKKLTLIFPPAPATTVASACFVPPTAGSMMIHRSLLFERAGESSPVTILAMCVCGHAPGHRKHTCELC